MNNNRQLGIEDLQPGDILLSPPNNWIGEAIVRLTGGKVSHSALYLGLVGKQSTIAHSYLSGTNTDSLFEFMDKDKVPFYYVRRHLNSADLQPVISAAKGYIEKNSNYPFGNLGVLAMLMLSKKFSQTILRSPQYYDYLTKVCLEVMIQLRKFTKEGKNAMTCSQFVSQCFTDAGKQYELNFDKLIYDYTPKKSISSHISLIELIEKESVSQNVKPLNIQHLLLQNNVKARYKNKPELSFFDLIDSKPISLGNEYIGSNTKMLTRVGATLAIDLCEVMTGKTNVSPRRAIAMLSKELNYFVTPDDLYSNASNLVVVGIFTAKGIKH